MASKKKISITIAALLLIVFIWYLFIKQSDYVITFKAKTATGLIYQGINEWAKQESKTENDEYKIVKKNKFNQIVLSSSKTIYNWEIIPVNDSINKVKVGLKDVENSLYNRLTLPFYSNSFKEVQKKKISDFKDELEYHLSQFKVGKIKEGTSSEVFVAYIPLKSVMQEKAQTMIASDALITGYLFNNNIKIAGKPYLEVTNWNMDTEQLEFNYCFPIDKNTKYVKDKNVLFKTISSKKGLTVSYFGNMRTSDRGWFAIYDYSKKNNIKLDYKPLEHFFANPYNGGNELEWETQIIIPYLE